MSLPVAEINSFRKAMGFVLKWEGGYSDLPDDAGGKTKWGISQRAHPTLDIENLTPEQALDIYAKEYWNPCGCDSIAFPLNVAVFDTAVNCGTSRAIRWAREAGDALGFLELRKQHYYGIINKNPTQVKFLNGWMNRLNDLKKFVEIALKAEET